MQEKTVLKDRIIAWVLLVVMLLSIGPISAIANGTGSPTDGIMFVTGDSITTHVGAAVPITAKAYSGGVVDEGASFTWESSDEDALYIPDDGSSAPGQDSRSAIAMAPGTVTVTVSTGTMSNVCTVTITEPIHLSTETSAPYNFTVEDGDVATSDKSSVITIEQNGTSVAVNPVGQGIANITITKEDASTETVGPFYVDTYNVFWVTPAGVTTETIEAGETPSYNGQTPTKNATSEKTYEFSGWSPVVEPVTADATYIAQFTENQLYDISIYDADDVSHPEVTSINLSVGDSARVLRQLGATVTPENYAENGDSIEWSSNNLTVAEVDSTGLVMAKHAGTAIITCAVGDSAASVTVNVSNDEGYFTVAFHIPGKEIVAYTLAQNEHIPSEIASLDTSKPEDAAATYEFIGWDPEISDETIVTGDVTYNAQYRTIYKEYSVTYKNYDGSTIQENTGLHFGDAIPEYTGETPTRATANNTEYTFSGWSPAITHGDVVEGNTVYIAQFSSQPTGGSEYVLQISESSRTGYVGETFTLTVATVPGEMASEFHWESSAPDVATVGELTGLVTFVAPGEADILVVDENGKYDSCHVTVNGTAYIITWDIEGVTTKDTVQPGETPVYRGPTPTKASTSDYYYIFTGWSPDPVAATTSTTYTAQFDPHRIVELTLNTDSLDLELNEHAALSATLTPSDTGDVVLWSSNKPSVATVDDEGNVVAVGAGQCVITAKVGPTQKTCNVTVSLPTYTISWYVNGTKVGTSQTLAGEMPVYSGPTPTKASTDEYTYAFSGWAPNLAPADANASYEAAFTATKRSYDIKFMVEGELYSSDSVEYGELITPPANPVKEAENFKTFSFSAWTPVDKLSEPVTGPVTFTAQFTESPRSNIVLDRETATMYVDDHLQLNAEVQPSDMEWRWRSSDESKATVNGLGYVTAIAPGEVTIFAESTDGTIQDSCTLTITIETFEVTWSVNGETTTQTYEKGETPVFEGSTDKAPTNTQVFTFTGWDHDIAPVTANITYTAQYTSGTRFYTVTWSVDGQETIERYTYGQTPIFRGSTAKEATETHTYLFRGWDKEVTTVSADVTYTAQYDEIPKIFVITWVVDGKQTTTLCQYGEVPSYGSTAPVKAATSEFTYTFKGWDTEPVACTEATTYTAVFESATRKYTVTWSVDGTTTTEEYTYGETPSFKGKTDKTATAEKKFTFEGWQPTIATVSADVTYTARYKEETRVYEITFKDSDGTVIEKKTMTYGQTPTPSTPSNYSKVVDGVKRTYVFKAWNPTITKVDKDQVYVATYALQNSDGSLTDPALAKKTFTATFKNWDGKLLEKYDVKGGQKPDYDGDTPTRPMKNGKRYTFVGWDPEIAAITEDTTYKAIFEETDADTLSLTEADLKAYAKETCVEFEFRCGNLYISKEGFDALAKLKTDITITAEENSKQSQITFKIKKKGNGTVITDEIPGLLFFATNMDSGDVVEVSVGTKGRTFKPENFSVITDEGAYVPIPGTCIFQTDSASNYFTDINSSFWSKNEVDFMVARGMVQGYEDGSFRPQTPITREQACVILHRLEELPSYVGGSAYDDMNPYGWYAKGVFWATANKLLPGVSNEKFGIREPITRQDQAVLMYNYAKYLGFKCSESASLAKFRDAGYLKAGENTKAMEWAVAVGIIQGTSTTTLNPNGSTTRAQFCTMMERFITYITVPTEYENYADIARTTTKTTSSSSK